MKIKYWQIQKFKREMPPRIPILTSSGDPHVEALDPGSPVMGLYFSKLNGPSKVLDIGAGEMAIKKALEVRKIKAEYRSMDIAQDSGKQYDYNDIEKIDGLFNLIIMQEILEHMPLEMGLRYLERAYELLDGKGFLIVTVPNTARPGWFQHGDFTHIQHYPLCDLYGILKSVGFSGEVIMRRVEIRPRKMTLKRRILLFIQKILFRLMGFDFAHSVLIILQKS